MLNMSDFMYLLYVYMYGSRLLCALSNKILIDSFETITSVVSEKSILFSERS